MKKVFRLACILVATSIVMSSCGVIFGGAKYNGSIIAQMTISLSVTHVFQQSCDPGFSVMI